LKAVVKSILTKPRRTRNEATTDTDHTGTLSLSLTFESHFEKGDATYVHGKQSVKIGGRKTDLYHEPSNKASRM
jgi:hypothetical protein